MRDYATAVAIIDGLENVIVRQVPVSIFEFSDYKKKHNTPTWDNCTLIIVTL